MENLFDHKARPKHKSKKTLYIETKKAVLSLLITLTSMIVVLGAIFLIFTNENSQKGYALQQEKLKNEQLKSELSAINAKITHSTAYSDLEDIEEVEGMKEAEEKLYVTEEDNKVE